jgi:hypothetical protein
MVAVGMNRYHQKLLGERFVYGLQVFLGYQGILDLKVPEHLKEGKIKINNGFYEGEGKRCAL